MPEHNPPSSSPSAAVGGAGFPSPATPPSSVGSRDPVSGLPRYGHSQTWLWRGWPIHFTYTPSRAQTASGQVNLTAAPAILIHGFGASVGHWRHNIVPLGSQRSVYALDLLGFGESAKPEIAYSVDLWVEQVYEFWRTHIQQPSLLVGHSIGGLVGVIVAARYPQMVKGLCLISCADGPHPEELSPPWDVLVQALCEGILAVLGCPLTYPHLFNWLRQTEVLRAWIKNVYKRDEQVDEELVQIFQRPAFEPGAAHVFLDSLRAILCRRFDSPKRLLPTLKMPILLLWGQEDPAVPSFLADQFKRWQPALTLVKLPGVGHCAHDELPHWVNTLISEWAASLETCPNLSTHLRKNPAAG
ncbi:alpha/beta hydrolase [Synechococcus sp. 63AY4M2]|uniref:alpha/beta fold hydrolase n=1 Tax=unclassified Synechococcus TaxID=2626047 RepID=UPI0000694064|nr:MULTISPECIES: alpha/beta fold hydrolase [unclassified Synechococcus]ABC98677.1 hydrolase, alpha/beta fold family [Synechococcus sp. JA-3-3Ab]PIK85859.1 alpha/beta hydrolase [Synechococcus sp. 63AY4M2]PIK91208.1 alpha/beta hydrolase [Synechococcus sp. 65AY6Li]PIK97173.1 alpha/beta hydrolase [Synechococcus sp. 63AY4M1]